MTHTAPSEIGQRLRMKIAGLAVANVSDAGSDERICYGSKAIYVRCAAVVEMCDRAGRIDERVGRRRRHGCDAYVAGDCISIVPVCAGAPTRCSERRECRKEVS